MADSLHSKLSVVYRRSVRDRKAVNMGVLTPGQIVWFSTWWGPRQIEILTVNDGEYCLSYNVKFVDDSEGKVFTVGHSGWWLSFEKP